MARSDFFSSEITSLVYVNGSGGWRTELFVEKLKEMGEGKFLLCNSCGGVLRDACLFEKDGNQELRCNVCIPKDVNKQIAQLNRETVIYKQVYCPLKSMGCYWTDELSELLHHLEECRLLPVTCPYSQYGCKFRDMRRNLERHEKEDMQRHLKLTVDHSKRFQSLLIPIISGLGGKGNLEWTISGVKNKISQTSRTFSEPFYVGLYKFQAKIAWNTTENFVGLFLQIMEGEWDDGLKWPIRYKYSQVIINQLDASDNYVRNDEITEKDLKDFPHSMNKPSTVTNNCLGRNNFISQADLLQEKYSKDDKFTLKISVELF